ncbi:MAG: DUF899 family protein [Pseudomonadales bacterium]
MDYSANRDAQMQLRAEIAKLRSELKTLQQQPPGQSVDNHTFDTRSGQVTLQTLFAGETHLIVIHNMGITCNHCTLWADGLNGLYEHLRSKAAFVVASPDEPRVQESFANTRNWNFPMVSDPGSAFAQAMGYTVNGGAFPGVSVFRQEAERIERIADAPFGENDLFCALWPLFDMLGEHTADWEPQLQYE